MTKADRIAIRVKCQPLLKEASAIVMGRLEYGEVKYNNPHPREDADYKGDNSNETFCGLPLKYDPCLLDGIYFLVPIPKL